MAKVGQTFNTSNSTVATLPKGATLKVSGSGKLEVTSIPVQSFKAGQRIKTKYGFATVVDPSSRFPEIRQSNTVLYVAEDGKYRVRRANISDVQSAY